VDNLTHTLIGLVAGEAVARCVPSNPARFAEPARRTTLLVVGMVGGNLPDVDLLWSMGLVTGDSVNYLVQHRGYTHTLLGCAILSLLLLLGTLAALRWRGHRLRPADTLLVAAMSGLAVMLHLGMDALNEYGVHPFWPWNNRWYYGDSLFIVEPLCWLAAAPLLYLQRTRGARVFIGGVLAIGCAAVLVFHGFGLAWWIVPAATLLLLVVGARMPARVAVLVSVGALCMVPVAFAAAHAVALRRVANLAAMQFKGAENLDIVLSPAAAHPFCWDVMLLQREGPDYVARIGQLNLVSDASRPCSRSLNDARTAPLRVMNRPVTDGMSWSGEYTMEITALARLANSNCTARRLASFLRAPFAARSERGWILGDLRYDRETGPGFAEMLVEPQSPARCGNPSPWTPPRRDLGF
jgi:inner membrane protein